LEALLFAADEPLSLRRLGTFVGTTDLAGLAESLEGLDAAYARDGSAVRLRELAGGYQLAVAAELHELLEPWKQAQEEIPLSEALQQTLAIVAYRQPITRADVEALRGGAAVDYLRQLSERGWVRVVGREESLGRPQLYGTTRKFLQEFGLKQLSELPAVEGLVPRGEVEKVAGSAAESIDASEGDENDPAGD
ncbi:MAG TPA: SMC-Scp complex subunit ScpB, partial [Planctomycetia bacterium]|nr:SMC-Scp complex subunit ScpB [Planctomycetia bacterium]